MKRTRKGFTLVELLVVIAILAILATVSVVGYTSFINRANDSVAQQELTQIRDYYIAGQYTENVVVNQSLVEQLGLKGTIVRGKINNDVVCYQYTLKSGVAYWNTSSNGISSTKPEGWAEVTCEHSWTDATCTVAKTCSLCGETEGQALGHDMQPIDATAVAATCEVAGKEADTDCSRCDHTQTGADIDALGHNYVDGICDRTGCGDVDEAYRAYYLVGYINGADYGCNDDDANTGIYKFVDGKLIVTFEKDSYVFVKSVNANGNNIGWFMADSLVTGKQATLTTGKTEKMLVPGGVTITFTLTNNNDTFTLDADYEGRLLYLKPNANWKVDGARFAAYYFNSSTDYGWVDMTSDGEYYRVLIPDGYANVIFCRMNPSAAANNWDNKWNQTSDLTVPTDGTNLYTVADGAWDNGDGTWSTK